KAEIVVTTKSMTAVRVSIRSAQSTLRSPEIMNGSTTSCASWCEKPTRTNAIHDNTMEMNNSVVVISSAVREPAAGGRWRGVGAGGGGAGGGGFWESAVGMFLDSAMNGGGVAVTIGAMITVAGRSARMARMGTRQRNDAGQDGAKQRQKDDCLIHCGFSPSSN